MTNYSDFIRNRWALVPWMIQGVARRQGAQATLEFAANQCRKVAVR